MSTGLCLDFGAVLPGHDISIPGEPEQSVSAGEGLGGASDGFFAAYQPAEVAAYAVLGYEAGPAGLGVEGYGLVTSVHAGNVAPPAAVADILIEYGKNDGISFDTLMVHYRTCGATDEIA